MKVNTSMSFKGFNHSSNPPVKYLKISRNIHDKKTFMATRHLKSNRVSTTSKTTHVNFGLKKLYCLKKLNISLTRQLINS